MTIFEAIILVAFLMALILCARWVWRMTDWDRPESGPKWSNWIPTTVRGEPGFEHSRKVKGYNFNEMDEPEETDMIEAHFVPLTSFIGKDCKPVTYAEWLKLYQEKKPYRWHLSDHISSRPERQKILEGFNQPN
jgi:hypothetical protein